jgi:hypothetical protein
LLKLAIMPFASFSAAFTECRLDMYCSFEESTRVVKTKSHAGKFSDRKQKGLLSATHAIEDPSRSEHSVRVGARNARRDQRRRVFLDRQRAARCPNVRLPCRQRRRRRRSAPHGGAARSSDVKSTGMLVVSFAGRPDRYRIGTRTTRGPWTHQRQDSKREWPETIAV